LQSGHKFTTNNEVSLSFWTKISEFNNCFIKWLQNSINNTR
jgi:hypothetical protein